MRQPHLRHVVLMALITALLSPTSVAFADPDVESTATTDTAAVSSGTVSATGAIAALTPAPVLVIRSYATSPARAVVGTPFDLTIAVHNATGRRADNVVVSLGQSAATASASPSALTVLGTGNAKFLGTLKGQRESTVTFQVIAPPGTSPGAITVPVTVSFEHQDARQEVAYTIGILVERNASLSLVMAEAPTTAVVGEPFPVSFEIANAGSFALSGVTLSVETSEAVVTDGTVFIGTMDAAATEGIDATVLPEREGSLDVSVVLSYTDEFGRPQSYRQTKTVTVEAPAETGTEEDTEGADEGGDNWFIAFIKALFGLGS